MAKRAHGNQEPKGRATGKKVAGRPGKVGLEPQDGRGPATAVADAKPARMKRAAYEAELARLDIELARLQEWIRHAGLRVVVIFEGRDAAGKGGTIKTISASLNPRICRVVASARRPSARRPSGISSATWSTCRRPARWSCSTGAGTTGRASSG